MTDTPIWALYWRERALWRARFIPSPVIVVHGELEPADLDDWLLRPKKVWVRRDLRVDDYGPGNDVPVDWAEQGWPPERALPRHAIPTRVLRQLVDDMPLAEPPKPTRNPLGS